VIAYQIGGGNDVVAFAHGAAAAERGAQTSPPQVLSMPTPTKDGTSIGEVWWQRYSSSRYLLTRQAKASDRRARVALGVGN
jgi:hypothetical protein